MNLPIGTLLQGGRYEILRYISSGGFGCTYEARDNKFKSKVKSVAIKEFFVKDFCNRDPESNSVLVATQSKTELIERLQQKFIEEAEALYDLAHPNIVRVTDKFEENNTAYYVMDYIDGRSLGKLIDEKGPLGEAEAIDYIKQIASALGFVHSHNRLHLDVKPQNIMIDQSGKAVLIDFGVSKQYDEVNGENTSTLLGCTPGYAPIEQSGNGVSEFYPSTDIYALGATLYKALTGKTPLPAHQRASSKRLKELQFPEGISPATREAVECSMQLYVDNRPQSVEEFLSLLESTDNREQRIDNRVQSTDNRVQSTDNRVQRVSAKAIEAESEETRAVEKETEQVAITNNEAAKPKKNRIAWVVAVLGVLIGCGLFFAFLSSDGNDDISTSQKVDLGLSVCWAGWNVGASSPEGYGNYYAWGETTTKSDYTESSYQYHNGSYYADIGFDIDGTEYDVARAQWGGNWRMPTNAECQELLDSCTWTWTSYKGIDGYKVTGPNGNSIFLPAAGHRYGTALKGRGSVGDYWLGSLSYSYAAYRLHFNSADPDISYMDREYGLTARPVCDK